MVESRYKAYPRYKATAFLTAPEIPDHWSIKRLKFTSREPIKNGIGAPSDVDDPELPRYVRITDIKSARCLHADTFRSLPTDLAATASFTVGDILLASVGATFGKSYLHQSDIGPVCYAGYLTKYSPASDVESRFASYWTESGAYWGQLNAEVIQSTVQNFSAARYADLALICPSWPEQENIADFLDRETAKIDALIAKKERLIELLEEKRAALITHAVTRGLNADTPLRNSGIEWLGQIPKHWEVRRLKNLARITYGIGEELDRLALTGTPIISLPNVTIDGRLDLGDTALTPLREADKRELLLSKGDLLFNWRNGSSDHVGKTARFAADGEYTHVSFLLRLKFDQSQCDSRYYQRYLNSLRSTGFFSSTKAGVNNTFNQTELQNLYVVRPPVEEQRAIVDSIEVEIERVIRIISTTGKAIEKLNEYRAALITAAVTGKIDVRGEAKAA